MIRRKPRIVVFYGGGVGNFDLSQETGQWVCEYIPRSSYDVTPVEVTPDGNWKVPLGNLPKSGVVGRTMHMLSQAVRALNPTQAVERLLNKPVDGLFTVVRGKGGDDGSLHSFGNALHIPVVGASAHACQQTSNKHLFAKAAEAITNTPYTRRFRRSTPTEEIIDDIRDEFVPPFFVKPESSEGSYGIEYVESLDEAAGAIERVKQNDDIIVQEKIPGTEFSLTLMEDGKGKIHALPPTVVLPKKTAFYDHLSKRRGGRVMLHTPHLQDNPLIIEAEGIARDIYDGLDCKGIATIDMVAGDNALDVLEVNTIPTLSDMTPLKHQLKVAGLHPSRLFDQLITRTLTRGF